MQYKTLIFDLDGTLVTSQINFPAIYQKLGLKPGSSIVEYVNSLKEPERQWALDVVHHFEDESAQLSKINPGIGSLLDKLIARQVNIAVFTLNSRATALKTLELNNISIPLLIAREDAQPKPNPEGLLKICDYYSTSPEKALFVGDYKYDLMAGKNANIKTALYAPTIPDFSTTDAYLQFGHFDELADYLFQSSNLSD